MSLTTMRPCLLLPMSAAFSVWRKREVHGEIEVRASYHVRDVLKNQVFEQFDGLGVRLSVVAEAVHHVTN